MPSWEPDRYLRFTEERTRPCRDLAGRIAVENTRSILDLGCGPGNSSAVLAGRWPSASITGLDSSAAMLDQARRDYPEHAWILGDIADWPSILQPEYDIVFSNAALQWVPDHAAVLPKLLSRVASGGVLALQVPADVGAPAHRLARELAASLAWRDKFSVEVREWFVHSSAFYYDVLSSAAKTLDLWETEYIHVMPGVESIGEWYRGTGLRPFLDALGDQRTRDLFINEYVEALRGEYGPRADGHVLFPFRRLFLIAGA